MVSQITHHMQQAWLFPKYQNKDTSINSLGETQENKKKYNNLVAQFKLIQNHIQTHVHK